MVGPELPNAVPEDDPALAPPADVASPIVREMDPLLVARARLVKRGIVHLIVLAEQIGHGAREKSPGQILVGEPGTSRIHVTEVARLQAIFVVVVRGGAFAVGIPVFSEVRGAGSVLEASLALGQPLIVKVHIG